MFVSTGTTDSSSVKESVPGPSHGKCADLLLSILFGSAGSILLFCGKRLVERFKTCMVFRNVDVVSFEFYFLYLKFAGCVLQF